MSATLALLHAQTRPAEEARRITEAIGVALRPDSEGIPASPEDIAAATATISMVNQQIADEKAPRREAPTIEHLGRFAAEPVPDGFDDDGGEPAVSSTHRVHAAYQLEDEPVEEAAAESPSLAEQDDTTPGAEVAQSWPWHPDEELNADGMAVAATTYAETQLEPQLEPQPEPEHEVDTDYAPADEPEFVADPDPAYAAEEQHAPEPESVASLFTGATSMLAPTAPVEEDGPEIGHRDESAPPLSMTGSSNLSAEEFAPAPVVPDVEQPRAPAGPPVPVAAPQPAPGYVTDPELAAQVDAYEQQLAAEGDSHYETDSDDSNSMEVIEGPELAPDIDPAVELPQDAETVAAVEPSPDPVSVDEPASFAPWEQDAQTRTSSSPWDDQDEIDPSLAAPARPSPAAAPDPVPDDDGGIAALNEASRDPAPSSRATPPPDSIDAPDPEPSPSVKQRLHDAVSVGKLRGKITNPKKALAIAAGVLTVIVIFTVVVMSFKGGGRGKPAEPAGQVAQPPSAAENTQPAAGDVTLVPSTVAASCGNDSDSIAPFSGDKTRAWVCKRINGLDLNVLNITFSKPVVITSITVVPGFNYIAPDGRDEWSRHRLVTAVSWRMGGKVYPQNLTPTRTGVTKQFPSVITQEMSMTITGSTRPPVGQGQNKGLGGGDTYDPKKIDETTAISKIVITGHPVDPGAGN